MKVRLPQARRSLLSAYSVHPLLLLHRQFPPWLLDGERPRLFRLRRTSPFLFYDSRLLRLLILTFGEGGPRPCCGTPSFVVTRQLSHLVFFRLSTEEMHEQKTTQTMCRP